MNKHKRDFKADRRLCNSVVVEKWVHPIEQEKNFVFYEEAITGWPKALDRIEELEKHNDKLQHSLEVAEKECDSFRCVNNSWNLVLEHFRKTEMFNKVNEELLRDNCQSLVSMCNETIDRLVFQTKNSEECLEELLKERNNSAVKIKKLADALEAARKFLPNATSLPRKIVTEIGTTVKMVDDALAEWRGE